MYKTKTACYSVNRYCKGRYKEHDKLKYNLKLRSKGCSASSFYWDDPLCADGVPILARPKVGRLDPNIKISYNNFAVIQKNKAGYMANIKRDYTDDIGEDVRKKYMEFDKLNRTKSLWKKMLFSCAGWGNTYSLCYLDEQKRVRIKQIDAWSGKVIYDDNGEPEKAYIYYFDDDTKIKTVYEYDKTTVTVYEKKENSEEFTIKEAAKPHGFGEIPVIEWLNNDNKQGNSEVAVSLLDAYDRLMSDNVTEWATYRNAYLVLKNIGKMTDEDQERLDKTGIFTVDGDGSDVKFLTKNVNPEFVKYITEETWAGIWTVSSTVDPRALASLANATAFQISQMFSSMEEDAKNTELEWETSFEYLDKVLKSYWTALATPSVTDYDTQDINYVFGRNLPQDVMTWLESIKRAGGMLPQSEIFKKAGYDDDKKVEELVKEAADEMTDNLPPIDDI